MVPRFAPSPFRGWPRVLAGLLALASALAIPANAAPLGTAALLPQQVHSDLVAEVSAVSPGQPFLVAIRLRVEPSWHIYWINYGDTGAPTKIDWRLPPGWTAGPPQWPTPQREPIPQLNQMNYGYEGGTVLVLVKLTPPADLAPGSPITLQANLDGLVCDADECDPFQGTPTLELPVAPGAPQFNQESKSLIDEAQTRLPQPPAMLDVSAWRDGTKLFLGLQAKVGNPLPDALADVYFFSEKSQTKPAAPQILRHTNNGWILEMTLGKDAPADLKSLPGVLTIQGSWSSGASIPALEIDPPLADVPPPAFADAAKNSSPDGGLGFFTILAFGFLGGIILNIFPCVFPVLGIKVLGFVRQAGEARRKVVLHGLTFTAGILISMWALAALLLSLRASGAQLGWGFQLQEPAFVLGLALLFLLFGLSLSGVFEIGGSLIGLGSNLTAKSGLAGSFFQGALAVVVATPCTAPLLGTALGAALALPTIEAFFIFTAIALGLASPYLMLSLFPGLARLLPRPGAWMETFKQFTAFPLYGAVGFLVYTLAGQVSAERFLRILIALVVVAMAAWIYGRYAIPSASDRRRRFGRIGGFVLLAVGVALAYWQPAELKWEPWSAARVAELQKAGQPIYVDFTARWCVTCQVNKSVVFHSPAVLAAIDQSHIALLRADWTMRDPDITNELARFGRAAVPFDLLYLPGRAEPIVLPATLTPGIVLDALNSGQTPPK